MSTLDELHGFDACTTKCVCCTALHFCFIQTAMAITNLNSILKGNLMPVTYSDCHLLANCLFLCFHTFISNGYGTCPNGAITGTHSGNECEASNGPIFPFASTDRHIRTAGECAFCQRLLPSICIAAVIERLPTDRSVCSVLCLPISAIDIRSQAECLFKDIVIVVLVVWSTTVELLFSESTEVRGVFPPISMTRLNETWMTFALTGTLTCIPMTTAPFNCCLGIFACYFAWHSDLSWALYDSSCSFWIRKMKMENGGKSFLAGLTTFTGRSLNLRTIYWAEKRREPICCRSALGIWMPLYA